VKWRTIPMVLVCALFLFPIYWMFVASFQPATGIMKMPPELYPHSPTLLNFSNVFEGPIVARWIANTVVITGSTIMGALLVNGTAAYAFAMFKFRGSQIVFTVFLASLMITRYAIIIPTFVLLKWYHISGALAVIAPALFWPLGILLATNYFRSIPASLVESARIDGAHEVTILARIVAPLCKPIVAALVVYKGLEVMQDYMWQVLVLQGKKQMTLFVGTIYHIYERFQVNGMMYDYGHANAVGVVLFVPLLVIFLLANKYFISGLTLGAIKE
jgi:multiple sugar transport system permease protein